jgi:hypothetical protein
VWEKEYSRSKKTRSGAGMWTLEKDVLYILQKRNKYGRSARFWYWLYIRRFLLGI